MNNQSLGEQTPGFKDAICLKAVILWSLFIFALIVIFSIVLGFYRYNKAERIKIQEIIESSIRESVIRFINQK